jgi:hypothetical protein
MSVVMTGAGAGTARERDPATSRASVSTFAGVNTIRGSELCDLFVGSTNPRAPRISRPGGVM